MSLTRRTWLATFAEPEAMAALREAAKECMAVICDHRPPDCSCSENLMTPADFACWIEDELAAAERDPDQPRRRATPHGRKRGEQLTLAMAS